MKAIPLHPQWIVVDLAQLQQITSIQIKWAEPYAVHYIVQYWTGDDPIKAVTRGVWQTFPGGVITNGQGGSATLQLSATPLPVRFLRILMTESSNTCDSHGSSDPRNCVGYAIYELYHRNDHGGRKISRRGASHRGPGADHHLLLLGGSLARAFRFAFDEAGAGGIRFVFYAAA